MLEFLPWIKEIDRQLVDIDRVARWCGAAGVSCTWNQLAENSRDPSRARRIIEQAHALHADGCRVFAQVSPRPFNLNVSFDQTPAFVAVPAWGQLITQTPDEKRRTLVDDAWRARARADWDRVGDGFTIFPVSRIDRVRLTSVRDGEERFLGGTLADVVAARGGHPSDVLADWVREHDLAPGMVAEALSNNDAGKVSELILDPTTVVGASDAGAHLQMMCGAGDSTLLFTEHVRDRGDLTVEAGVHQLTGRIADAFGIHDRGVVREGLAGDVVVFALDELDVRARAVRRRSPRRRAPPHPARRRLPAHRGRRRRDPGGWRRDRRPARRPARRRIATRSGGVVEHRPHHLAPRTAATASSMPASGHTLDTCAARSSAPLRACSTMAGKSRCTSTVPLRLPTMRRLRSSALASNDGRAPGGGMPDQRGGAPAAGDRDGGVDGDERAAALDGGVDRLPLGRTPHQRDQLLGGRDPRRDDELVGAEVGGGLGLGRVDVDRDDACAPEQARGLQHVHADPADAEHHDGVARLQPARRGRPRRNPSTPRTRPAPPRPRGARPPATSCAACTTVAPANDATFAYARTGSPRHANGGTPVANASTQAPGRPDRHARHRPHATAAATMTSSPTDTVSTPSPMASTIPAAS